MPIEHDVSSAHDNPSATADACGPHAAAPAFGPVRANVPSHRAACVVVIPAYQPGSVLVDIVRTMAGLGYRVVVVNDGSSFALRSVWEALSSYATVVEHAENLGKGAALKTGFQAVRSLFPDAKLIMTMDADGQHRTQDADAVACAAWEHPGALVLGSRTLDGKAPWRSRLGNSLMRVAFSCVCGASVRDTQTGLRAFWIELLDSVLVSRKSRFDYETDVLARCVRQGVPVEEVPICAVYHDARNPCSHFSSVRDSLLIMRTLAKFAASSFVSFLVDLALFSLFSLLLGAAGAGLVAANACARVVSATLNYRLNATVVFGGGRPVSRTLPAYCALAACVLGANSVLLFVLVNACGLPAMAAKVAVEATLFVASFAVQRFVVWPAKRCAREQGRERRKDPANAQGGARSLHVLRPERPTPSAHSAPRHIPRKAAAPRVLRVAAVVALDVVLTAGVVAGDYCYAYVMPHKLDAASVSTTAAPASPQAVPPVDQPLASNATSQAVPMNPLDTANAAGAAATPDALRAKFKDHFSSEVVSTDTVYRSPDVAVELSYGSYDSGVKDPAHESYGTNVRYVLADIYVSDVSSFQTAFAQDTYGVGYNEKLSSMAGRLGSILAMNGDSYSNNRHQNNGTVVRNGTIYRCQPSTEETCVLFRDGTMKIYAPGAISSQELVDGGAWQSWVFGPSLLDDQGRAKNSFVTWDYIRESHPRSALGYFEPGHYCLLTVDGRQNASRGMFLDEMAQLFQSLGCAAAYNLDGGHCSFMARGTTYVNNPYKPTMDVSDGIFICEPSA